MHGAAQVVGQRVLVARVMTRLEPIFPAYTACQSPDPIAQVRLARSIRPR